MYIHASLIRKQANVVNFLSVSSQWGIGPFAALATKEKKEQTSGVEISAKAAQLAYGRITQSISLPWQSIVTWCNNEYSFFPLEYRAKEPLWHVSKRLVADSSGPSSLPPCAVSDSRLHISLSGRSFPLAAVCLRCYPVINLSAWFSPMMNVPALPPEWSTCTLKPPYLNDWPICLQQSTGPSVVLEFKSIIACNGDLSISSLIAKFSSVESATSTFRHIKLDLFFCKWANCLEVFKKWVFCHSRSVQEMFSPFFMMFLRSIYFLLFLVRNLLLLYSLLHTFPFGVDFSTLLNYTPDLSLSTNPSELNVVETEDQGRKFRCHRVHVNIFMAQ